MLRPLIRSVSANRINDATTYLTLVCVLVVVGGGEGGHDLCFVYKNGKVPVNYPRYPFNEINLNPLIIPVTHSMK